MHALMPQPAVKRITEAQVGHNGYTGFHTRKVEVSKLDRSHSVQTRKP
jgi:hypothetical protein